MGSQNFSKITSRAWCTITYVCTRSIGPIHSWGSSKTEIIFWLILCLKSSHFYPFLPICDPNDDLHVGFSAKKHVYKQYNNMILVVWLNVKECIHLSALFYILNIGFFKDLFIFLDFQSNFWFWFFQNGGYLTWSPI